MQGNAETQTSQTAVKPYKSFAFDQFLTYSALGGLLITDDGKLENMPAYKFCERVGVDQATTWRWKQQPDFGLKVRQRREEIMPLARETKMWNQLYILGLQTQDKRAAVDAIKTWLGHFGELKLPVQRQDVKVEHSLAAAFSRADQVIEGELADGSRASAQDAEEARLIPPTT